MIDINNKIIKILIKLKEFSIFINNPFKTKAYETAINEIQKYNNPITINKIPDIPKIGNKIRKKIHEIITTGKLKEIEKLDNNMKLFNIINKIPGFGPNWGLKIINNNEIKSVKDIPNFYELTKLQKLGIKYYKKLIIPLSRKNAELVYTKLHSKFNKYYKIILAGSYRRGKKKLGDIDIVMIEKQNKLQLDKIKSKIKSLDIFITFINAGEKKISFLAKIDKTKITQIDLRFFLPKHYATAILYFTGSKNFNIDIRRKANRLGLSLNEYELKEIKSGKIIKTKKEEDIFKAIGIKYIEPKLR